MILIFFTHGISTVRAWLQCTVGSQTVTSNVVENQVIILTDSTDTNTLIAIQNPNNSIVNYETVTLFDYVIYNPVADPVIGSDVTFKIANNAYTQIHQTVVAEGVQNESLKSLTTMIGIESENTSLQFSVFAGINDSTITVKDLLLTVSVDNSIDYSPTSNADFFMNPKLRNNQEANPARIINNITNKVITGCTFTNMSWIDGVDGWMLNEDGVRVLRVLAGSKIKINYNAFSQFFDDNSSNHSLAIEIDFAVRNITNEDNPVFTMGGVDGNGNIHGVYMLPLNGAFKPASIANWLDTDISWQEGVRTHVIYDLQHDYYVANIDDNSQTQLYPIIRTFINGVICRETPLLTAGDATEVTVNTNDGKRLL
jgi:hypothetical protein